MACNRLRSFIINGCAPLELNCDRVSHILKVVPLPTPPFSLSCSLSILKFSLTLHHFSSYLWKQHHLYIDTEESTPTS